MYSMLMAELAVLLHFQTIRVVLLVLICLIVSLLALFTSQCELVTYSCFGSHFSNTSKISVLSCIF